MHVCALNREDLVVVGEEGSPTEERGLMQRAFEARRVDEEPKGTNVDTGRADGNSVACGLWLGGGERRGLPETRQGAIVNGGRRAEAELDEVRVEGEEMS
ncbi:hypothetical protein PIB30_036070, partial [Stylosanthes scabra]|nr:hypothetical protein [Stylosanthes scabra]